MAPPALLQLRSAACNATRCVCAHASLVWQLSGQDKAHVLRVRVHAAYGQRYLHASGCIKRVRTCTTIGSCGSMLSSSVLCQPAILRCDSVARVAVTST